MREGQDRVPQRSPSLLPVHSSAGVVEGTGYPIYMRVWVLVNEYRAKSSRGGLEGPLDVLLKKMYKIHHTGLV